MPSFSTTVPAVLKPELKNMKAQSFRHVLVLGGLLADAVLFNDSAGRVEAGVEEEERTVPVLHCVVALVAWPVGEEVRGRGSVRGVQVVVAEHCVDLLVSDLVRPCSPVCGNLTGGARGVGVVPAEQIEVRIPSLHQISHRLLDGWVAAPKGGDAMVRCECVDPLWKTHERALCFDWRIHLRAQRNVVSSRFVSGAPTEFIIPTIIGSASS